MKKLLFTLIGLSLVAESTMAQKPLRKKMQKRENRADKDPGERGAAIEEKILDKKDQHGADIEAGKDKRPSGLNEYHTYSYGRIKALLRSGKITEEQGTVFKKEHADITKLLSVAKGDGTLTKEEIASVRASLDMMNDGITAVAGSGEENKERTPLLNATQSRMEEALESGIRNGRISTLEGNSLKRKLKRAADLEDRLKKDKEISKNERERLFEEVNEIRRDLKKALYR